MKILDSNIQGLIGRRLVPGVDVAVNEDFLKQIEIWPASVEGHYLKIPISGRDVILGSQYSDQKLVEKQSKGLQLQPHTFYSMMGFDSGEYIRRVLKILPKSSHLFCLEPHPEFFYKICMMNDISDILRDSRFNILLENNLNRLETLTVDGGPFFKVSLYKKSAYLSRPQAFWLPEFQEQEWRAKMETKLKEAVLFNIYSFNTVDASIKNYFDNTLKSLENQDWSAVSAACQHQPLVIVGMGPSMSNEMDRLRDMQKYCRIGCVDNAFRELLHQGIKPDFVFAVEWQDVSLDFYAGVELPDDVTLVCLPGICTKLMELWKGPMVVYPAVQLMLVWRDLVNKTVPPFMGNNVGMLAVQFAMYIKASPVYLVGFDYCAPWGNYNHPNAAYVWNVYPDMTRFWSFEKIDFWYIRKHPMFKEETGIDGDKIYTLQSMMEGRVQMGKLLQSSGRESHFINCSPHVLLHEAVRYGALDELLALTQGVGVKKNLQPSRHSVDPQQIKEEARNKIKQVRKYYSQLKEIYFCAKDLLALLDQGQEEIKAKAMAQFYEQLKIMQEDKSLAWIEATMVELDRRLLYLMEADRVAREEAKSENDKMLHMVRFFLDQYAVLSSYEEFFKKFFHGILEELKSAELQVVEGHP